MGGGDASTFSPNVEAILSLRPDLMFQWANSGDDVISVLDRTGLPVLGMRAGTWDNFTDYVRIMGQVAGKEARAEALLDRQRKVTRDLQSALTNIPTPARPRVLYFGRAANMLRVHGGGSFNEFYIRLAGGENAAGDNPAISTVTIEQILTWNPQVMLLGNFDAALPADFYDDPRWQSVDAIRNHRVYRMPLGGYRWDPPSQASGLSWLWLAGLLQPGRVNINLRSEMRDWFEFLYEHPLTDDEIDQILFVKENQNSAGYDRYSKR
jgi:iron complex transport system substrate-binding protein